MRNGNAPLQRQVLHSHYPAKHREFLRVSLFVSLSMFAGSIAGCLTAPMHAQDTSPTAMVNCWPASVFTAKDMQARVDCHPNAYKLQISKDTVVLFAFPNPIIDWVGPVFIIHVPSVSEAVVNMDGSLFMKDYKTPEGKAAIERVLNNSALMAKILDRAKEIQEGTLIPPTAQR